MPGISFFHQMLFLRFWMTNQVCMSDAVKCKEAKTHRTIQIPFSSEACFFASIVFGFSLNLFLPLSLSPCLYITCLKFVWKSRARLLPVWVGFWREITGLWTGDWSHGGGDIEKARFTFFPSSSGWMQHNLKILKFAQEIPKLDPNIMGWHAPFLLSSQKR